MTLGWREPGLPLQDSERGCPNTQHGAGVPDSDSWRSAYRGGMIQTAEQYQFLHHTLALYAAQLPPESSP